MQRTRLLTSAIFGAAMTCAAAADFTNLSIELQCDGPDGYFVYRMFAYFDDPADEMVGTGNVIITTGSPGGFWQAPLGEDTAPLAVAVAVDPETAFDSFVTVGMAIDDGTDSTLITPRFAFSGKNQIVGGWSNANPANPNGQMLPDAAGRVMLAQFTLSQAPLPVIDGTAQVLWRDADTGNVQIDQVGVFVDLLPDCPADFNNDMEVNAADLAVLLAEWGSNSTIDLDCDGEIGASDLAILLSSWGVCF